MHVENDLVEFVTIDDQEYEEIVEEYKEEIFMPKEFQESPVIDTTDTAPAQGKLQCITHIFDNPYIYMWRVTEPTKL
jgi:adenine specific DNA methylase Mod